MSQRSSPSTGDWQFFRHLLIALGVVGLAYVLWATARILILLFAAVLLAILLAGLTGVISRQVSIAYRWVFLSVTLVIAALLATGLFLFGAQLGTQLTDVVSRVPQAVDAAGERIGIQGASGRINEAFSSGSGGQFLSQVASLGYTVIGGLADLVLVLITAVFLAADPRPYRRGLVKLFSPDRQERVLRTMDKIARALRLWFAGQLVSMVVVGILSGLAFWFIGLPSAIGLGVIAGLTNFVPFLGPIVGAIPALLFAVTQDLTTVLWTAAAILAIQQLEGNVVLPLVQQRAVDLPPAVVLFAIAVFGTLFGIPGIILAVPLGVVVMILVQELWVREALGERTTVLGDRDRSR